MLRQHLRYLHRRGEAFVALVDGVKLFRSSRRFPGSFLQPLPQSVPWKRGLGSCQRYLHGALLVSQDRQEGYSRALPLRLLPAFPASAAGDFPAHYRGTLAEKAVAFAHWLRTELDSHGYWRRQLLIVADGEFEQLKIWQNLPPRVIWMVRTRRNRRLYQMSTPPKRRGKGRPRLYGPTAGEAWEVYRNWPSPKEKFFCKIRGKQRRIVYKVCGPSC